jgi:hypothetical protein
MVPTVSAASAENAVGVRTVDGVRWPTLDRCPVEPTN